MWFNNDDDDDVDSDVNSDIGGGLAVVTVDKLDHQELCCDEGSSMRLVATVYLRLGK